MVDSGHAQADDGDVRRCIIELSSDEARGFLLDHESYCNVELPSYFNFNKLLQNVAAVLQGQQLSCFQCRKPRDADDVNYAMLHNKNGRYAWRPLELVHPALYVALVNSLTEPTHWQLLIERFNEFKSCPRIKCLSLPTKVSANEHDEDVQTSRWWSTVERKSVELAMDYEFVIHTDITDCYAAIYTHSIAWALHTKPEAKQRRRDPDLIGNIVDNHILDMKQGQTNGIPQGSVLMDFIAEMVLGYADTELEKAIACRQIADFQILRYRDDYRVFVNNPQDGEQILKCLTQVMIDLGLQLNPKKTNFSGDVIRHSVKSDKLAWEFRRHDSVDLQRLLTTIHDHSMEHPNAGSLNHALRDYHKRLLESEDYNSPLPLVSIVTDIALRNPKTQAIAAAILSKLISYLAADSDRQDVVARICKRFNQIPNTGHMQVWLQRISLPFDPAACFDEPLCRVVHPNNEQPRIWNSSWISSNALLEAIDAEKLIDRDELERIEPVISVEEAEQSIWNRWPYY